MSDAQTILKMIEEVDPADTAKLDEIDARVMCLLEGWEFKDYFKRYNCDGTQAFTLDENETLFCLHYTRSRDALKAIRPEGWSFQRMYSFADGTTQLCLHKVIEGCEKAYTASRLLPTEELAELHAVIQAIDRDRSQK